MADHSNSQELENNSWVITGSLAPPVEDLGFEASAESPLEASATEGDLFVDSPDLEEEKAKSPETDDTLLSTEASHQLLSPEPTLSPSLDEKETGSQNPEEECLLITPETVVIPPTGPLEEERMTSSLGEEPASSEADLEGLRRRKGHADVHPVGPELPHRPAGYAPDEESDGFSRTKWLLAILAVVGFGVLAVLGVMLDTEDGALDVLNVVGPSSDGEEPYPAISRREWPPSLDSLSDAKLHPSKEARRPSAEAAGDPRSLDAMGALLDKLAKENQDIRLMQAELQAQKEELQALLQKSEGETLAASSRQQNVAAENSRLAEALRRETAALSAARGEIQLLQEQLRSLGQDSEAQSRQPPEEEAGSRPPPGKPELREKELHRLRSLLASLRYDLARAAQKAPLEELKILERRLARELGLGQAEKGTRVPWKESAKSRPGKAKPGQRKQQAEEKLRHPGRDPKVASERGPHHPKRHPAPQQAKPPKGGDPHRGNRKARKPVEPRELWEMLAKHPYSAPQGCSGVSECAHHEGLAPVQKSPFLKLVQNYLAGLGWEEYSSELLLALKGFFDGGGVFVHERISFREFLDEVEDALEELAQSLGVSEDQVDDFEEEVLRQLGAARRFTRGDGAKERSREGPLPKGRADG